MLLNVSLYASESSGAEKRSLLRKRPYNTVLEEVKVKNKMRIKKMIEEQEFLRKKLLPKLDDKKEDDTPKTSDL